jgi:WS/DGAT/MGAT family acyltransferase
VVSPAEPDNHAVTDRAVTRGIAVDRIGPGDQMTLASDVGPAAMNIGAVLLLAPGSAARVPEVEAVVAERVSSVPRCRQRLVDAPWGCGRPLWVDDAGFDVQNHLELLRCPAPGDERALLEVAAEAVTRPLPRSRPMWRALVVTGLAEDRVALVVVLHHVLADGVGGLAVLTRLADGGVRGPGTDGDRSTTTAPPTGPEPPADVDPGTAATPSPGRLLTEATRSRLRALARAPLGLGLLLTAVVELGVGGRPTRAPRCWLNRPTGPRRRFATVDVELEAVRQAAHRHGGTVNDALLVAVTRAMETMLRSRGEAPGALVVSVPISARTATTTGSLGNQVGVMPVRVELTGAVGTRLGRTAQETRTRRRATRGGSALLVGPAFRLLAAAGVLRWFVNRQRLVNSFLTNLRGPVEQLSLAGIPVTGIVPVTVSAGNVGAAFAVISYAGRLTTNVITDPDLGIDATTLADALRESLQEIINC